MRCWAAALGDCSKKQSGEHYLSKAIFGGSAVTIQGLPWCREAKTLPPPSLVANVLCKRHNEELSPVDAAGAHVYERISRLSQVRSQRQAGGHAQARKVTYNGDGLLFERWLLKALTSLVFDHAPVAEARGMAPSGWIEIVFGRAEFGSRCGLYVGRLPRYRTVVDRNRVGLEVLATTEGAVAGGAFNLNGVEWLVSVFPTERDGFTHRPRTIADWDGPTIWQSLDLNWVPRAASNGV